MATYVRPFWDGDIPIKNIFYMYAYVWEDLDRKHYEDLDKEDFEDIYDLYAEILLKEVTILLKRGLYKEYVPVSDALPMLRGQLKIQGTIREYSSGRQRLFCEYDVFSENNIYNQIVKIAIERLLKHQNLNSGRRDKLRSLMRFFHQVESISVSQISRDSIRYHRNNRVYQMLHHFCYFILDTELLTTSSGKYRLATVASRKKEINLFELFVTRYYQREHSICSPKGQEPINWAIEMGSDKRLPDMRSDLMLSIKDRTLIIDVKFYRNKKDRETVHPHTIYQMYSYVGNKDKDNKGNVDGLLLYAKTKNMLPETQFRTPAGNIFMVRLLDLNQDFKGIKEQLDKYLDYYKEFSPSSE